MIIVKKTVGSHINLIKTRNMLLCLELVSVHMHVLWGAPVCLIKNESAMKITRCLFNKWTVPVCR